MSHIPVLLQETIKYLNPQKGEIIVDATIGGGGHMKSFCEKVGEAGLLIGFDRDEEALPRAQESLEGLSCKHILICANFTEMKERLAERETQKVHKIFFDLGYSSFQIDSKERGFSFREDGPLDMRMSKKIPITAHDVVNTWKEETLVDILYGFGEERYSRRIARAIITARKKKSIETTNELARIVESSVPYFYRKGRIHPATKTFQAIRVAVNEELGNLQKVLPIAFSLLLPTGRIGVISFHSLEDRIVKNFFKDVSDRKEGILHTKKPITGSSEEIQKNPRARSAKLRILEKI
jgi:16S rRNA (cytosine1402-N4)-methyltransferase